jgi:hypothetical protein
MRNTDTITAYKGNQTQVFTRVSWDILGSDKYGWSLIPEVPKEVLSKFQSIESKDDAEKRDADSPRVLLGGDTYPTTQHGAGESLPEAPKVQGESAKPPTRKSKKRR